MPMNPHPTTFGVFKPVDHVLMSFATAAAADAAAAALRDAGFGAADIDRYTPQEMQAQAEDDIRNATAMASMGTEFMLVKAHLALALLGQSFIVVAAAEDDRVRLVTDIAVACHATAAQRYGMLMIEELVPPAVTPDEAVAEVLDRTSDA